MGTKKTAILTAAWIVSCALCAWTGHYFSKGPQPKASDDDGGVSATVIKLPPRKFVSAISRTGSDAECRINIFRTGPHLELVRAVKIWSGGKGILAASFRNDSGAVAEIHVSAESRRVRDWGLREDGSIEYSTVYKNGRGNRQYFDADGKPGRTETLVIHGGS